jgi:uncharacterized protein YbjT (DUF2867 family)
MKYVITGGAGNISRPLAESLLAAGHEVTVIGRDAGKLSPLTEKGASAAPGSLEDEAFVVSAFAGADAVYLMIPPNFAVDDLRDFQRKVAKNYVAAIRANGTPNVVVLSSIGAHLGQGVGPVDGLAELEGLLSPLKNVNVRVLRPSYFMYNLLSMIPLMKNMQIMGANFGAGTEKLVLVHPRDIAAAAAEELLGLNFKGHSVRYIAGDEKTGEEISAILSAAVGTARYPWVEFSNEQAFEGMKQAGVPAPFAKLYAEMGNAIREGKMQEDYWKNHPQLSATKLEDFAPEFAAAYQSAS